MAWTTEQGLAYMTLAIILEKLCNVDECKDNILPTYSKDSMSSLLAKYNPTCPKCSHFTHLRSMWLLITACTLKGCTSGRHVHAKGGHALIGRMVGCYPLGYSFNMYCNYILPLQAESQSLFYHSSLLY